jgi:hypothetical protein
MSETYFTLQETNGTQKEWHAYTGNKHVSVLEVTNDEFTHYQFIYSCRKTGDVTVSKYHKKSMFVNKYIKSTILKQDFEQKYHEALKVLSHVC